MKSSKLKKILFFIKIKFLLRNKKNFFIFPFYHIGGAERVHSDILKIFSPKNSICIISDTSENNHFYNEFKSKLQIIEIEKLSIFEKQRTIQCILDHINLKKCIVFGCNSKFFYDLIPNFKSQVKVIDLIHAFSYEVKTASEKYSLPIATRINKRVILGSKTYLDFEKLYQDNEIDSKYLKNLIIIKNKVKISQNFPIKPHNEKLKIIFVGRNSFEKRVHIFFKIAELCLIKKIDVKFYVIGNFDKKTTVKPDNTKIIGEISDVNILNSIYLQSDIIATTSSREGLPMVMLEGMALGVLPISTDVGEISELINVTLVNGFLIPNVTSEKKIIDDFCEKIIFLNQNRNLLTEYQKNAYNSVKEKYSEVVFESEYRKLFQKD